MPGRGYFGWQLFQRPDQMDEPLSHRPGAVGPFGATLGWDRVQSLLECPACRLEPLTECSAIGDLTVISFGFLSSEYSQVSPGEANDGGEP